MNRAKIYCMSLVVLLSLLSLSCTRNSKLDMPTSKKCTLTLNATSDATTTRTNFSEGTIIRFGLFNGYDETKGELNTYLSEIYNCIFAKKASTSEPIYSYNTTETFELKNIAYSNWEELGAPLIVATTPATTRDMTKIYRELYNSTKITVMCGKALATKVSADDADEVEYKANVKLNIVSTKLVFNIKIDKYKADRPIYVKRLELFSKTRKLFRNCELNAYTGEVVGKSQDSTFRLYDGSYLLKEKKDVSQYFMYMPIEDLDDISLRIYTSSDEKVSTNTVLVGNKLDDVLKLGDYVQGKKLVSGRVYTFNIVINSALRFDKVTISESDEWIEDNTDHNATI